MVNKLFIMMPVMFAARKLDAEDPNQVFWLRVAYATIQAMCVLIVAYTYIQATSVASKSTEGIIYVPPAPQVKIIPLELIAVDLLASNFISPSFPYLSFVLLSFQFNSHLRTPMRKKSTRKSSLAHMYCLQLARFWAVRSLECV